MTAIPSITDRDGREPPRRTSEPSWGQRLGAGAHRPIWHVRAAPIR